MQLHVDVVFTSVAQWASWQTYFVTVYIHQQTDPHHGLTLVRDAQYQRHPLRKHQAERFATSDRVYRRAVKELESKGFIAKEKKGLRILDLEGLRNFVEE